MTSKSKISTTSLRLETTSTRYQDLLKGNGVISVVSGKNTILNILKNDTCKNNYMSLHQTEIFFYLQLTEQLPTVLYVSDCTDMYI